MNESLTERDAALGREADDLLGRAGLRRVLEGFGAVHVGGSYALRLMTWRLIRFGKPLSTAIRELITIVSPRTFSRWLLDEKRKRKPGRLGRPPLVALRDLVVMIAGQT